jgi:MarR family transcriptional regulator, lower aerobic nicotinate degradation pathway regulator
MADRKRRKGVINGAASNPLWERPGFLIRRLHQIHSAMFEEACAGMRVTPVQYSVLTVVGRLPGIDQAGLAQEIGMDRSNATDVILRLERAGLLRRAAGEHDRRTRALHLTDDGTETLRRLDRVALRAHDELVEVLTPKQRQVFLRMLQRLVADKNDLGRAPFKIE